jgi:hypothetical protein
LRAQKYADIKAIAGGRVPAMVAASAACGLLIGYPYTAMEGVCLRRLDCECVGRPDGSKMMNFACEWGVGKSCENSL